MEDKISDMHTDMVLPASTVRGLSSTIAGSDVASEMEGKARRDDSSGGSSMHISKQQALLRVMAQKRVQISS